MAKKKYLKPIAEHVAFYTEEDITTDLPISWYANEEPGNNAGISGPGAIGGEGGDYGWGEDE